MYTEGPFQQGWEPKQTPLCHCDLNNIFFCTTPQVPPDQRFSSCQRPAAPDQHSCPQLEKVVRLWPSCGRLLWGEAGPSCLDVAVAALPVAVTTVTELLRCGHYCGHYRNSQLVLTKLSYIGGCLSSR